MKRWVMFTLTGLLAVSTAQAASYTIDPAHSSVGFRIKHLVGKVAGHFNKFSGSISYDPASFKTATVEAMIDATSIDTGNEKRDEHLRSPDFFDVAKYPTMTFKSDSITDIQGNKAKLHGQLTMHGVTKPVVLDLEVNGPVKSPMGKGGTAIGASATATVSRADFGIGATTGPMAGMLGKDVEIDIEIEASGK